jgi:hypothetical protein
MALNVRDFGARGCGGDDTAAFEDALDVLRKTTFLTPGGLFIGGGTLVVPTGLYRITRPLVIPPNTVVAGEGVMSMLLFNDQNWQQGPFFGSGIIAANYPDHQASPSCAIRDLSIGNENPANAFGAGIDCIAGALCHIAGVTTFGWRFHVVLDGHEHGLIERCNFTGFGAPSDYPQHPPQGTPYERNNPQAVGVWFVLERNRALSPVPDPANPGQFLRVPSRVNEVIDATHVNWVRNCQFNGPHVQLWHQGGQLNSVRDCNFESTGHCWVSGSNNFTIDHCAWGDEPGQDELILIDSPGFAAAVNLRIIDCLFVWKRPALRVTPGTVLVGLDFSHNDCQTKAPDAVVDVQQGNLAGFTIAIGNLSPEAPLFSSEVSADACVLYASFQTPGSDGTSHRRVDIGTVQPRARLDVQRMGNEAGFIERVAETVEFKIPIGE